MSKKIILSIIVFFFLTSCAKKIITPLTAEVNVVNEDRHKTIELRSIGFGSKKEDALYDSEKKAFEILFFRGIPNTSIENPLIGTNESELLAKHPAYFNSFFKNRYKSFIMSIYEASPAQRNKGVVSVVSDLKINILSLKKDL
ncbi:MAG: hypothetical protein JKY22_01765, partial [Flavobacteriaceae bacterium]|nr:hypothetical protein [Flavobacteriaceae bacterium]